MEPTKLYYTFGNHMHWVDMQWLWGYHVLPGSVRDMIHLCREAGVKGCVNFDGIGYEKLAAEDPEALAELRQAVQDGMIEPVGCSYGQPYGLFHGGESNIRQLIYGARTVRRLLGVWPKTFWEEEFYFFPQLPQMLRGCGFTGASLFFQWTWHTPEVPFEESPVIWWEGMDGSRILTATRNNLNLHQWPEDMDVVLKELASGQRLDAQVTIPLIQQWLELMPSPDWMCRSELILPKLKELLSDPRFEVSPVTLGEYLHTRGLGVPPEGAVEGEGASGQGRDAPENLGRDAQATGLVPVRNYSMDQVWHGLTLGKNGDRVRSRSRSLEGELQGVESLHAVLGLFGRPYSHWDVYPVWEIEEAWRTLLWTQHHDIDECEGLCGYVAENEVGKIKEVARTLHWRAENARCGKNKSRSFNPQGWEVDGVPPYGFGKSGKKASAAWEVNAELQVATYSCELYSVVADLEKACLTELRGPGGLNLLKEPFSLLPANAVAKGVDVVEKVALIARARIDGESFHLHCTLSDTRGILIFSSRQRTKRTKGGYEDATRLALNLDLENMTIDTDTPYGVVRVEGTSRGVRKYPHGDWMTSLQWFESVERGFTAGSFVAFRDTGSNRGLLVAQQASTQWFRRDDSVEMIAGAYDPWDENNFHDEDDRFFSLLPLTNESNAECWRIANTRSNDLLHGPWPVSISSALYCKNDNVVITAFYREAEDYAGKHVENYAGAGMGYPYIIRLVEFDGLESEVELTVVGPVEKVFKTNLLGQIESEVAHEFSHQEGKFSYEKITFQMRAHEIATLYLDIVPGRKQTRDLDAKREIWATVHRTEIEP